MSNYNLKQIWFDFWGKADDVKSNVLNSIFFRVDVFLSKIIDTLSSDPPTSPVDGDIVRIGPDATGRFAGKENYLAFYYNNAWRLVEPKEGFFYYDKSISNFIYYDGSQWTTNIPVGQCYPDHNLAHNYEGFEHIDWSEPGPVRIDVERLPEKLEKSVICDQPQESHYELLNVARTGDDEHIDWSEPGAEKVATERLGQLKSEDIGMIRMKSGKLFADIESHIVDADGTLSDITTKFNTLLSYLENLKILEDS